jgi:diadenosine tetraphosphate (Ap4A) HIT family hydrolase
LLRGTSDVFDSTWLADGGYKAMVSVGALVSGWTLICPEAHAVNLCDHYGRKEFWKFASDAAGAIERRYGKCSYFEHGASSEMSLTGCGVGHAHGHLVPLDFSLESEARREAPNFAWRECLVIEAGALARGREYLFVASAFRGQATKGSLCILEAPTSQFFRQLIARRLGIGDLYDYKKYPMLDIAAASARELRRHVSAVARA